MPPDDADIETELGHIETTLSLVEKLLGKRRWSTVERAAMGTFLQNTYGGLENLFRCLLAEQGVGSPKGEYWHKKLLQLAFEKKIVPEYIRDDLRNLLLFRHMHVHGYAHMLDEDRLRQLASKSLAVCRVAVAALWNR